jgi:hypothetical protein
MKTLSILVLALAFLGVGQCLADHVKSVSTLGVDECPTYPFEQLENTNFDPPTDVSTVPDENKSISPWFETKIIDTGGVNEEAWISEVDFVSICEITWKQFGFFSDGKYCIYLGKTGEKTSMVVLDLPRTTGSHDYKIARKLNQQTEFYFDGELVYATPAQMVRSKFVQTFLSYWSNPLGTSSATTIFSSVNNGWTNEPIVVDYKSNGFVKLRGAPGLRVTIRLDATYGSPPQTKSWYLVGNFSATGESCHYVPDLPIDTVSLTADTIGLAVSDSVW